MDYYRFDFGDSILYRFPQKGVIYSEIEMYQLISHSSHFLPGNDGIFPFYFFRDLLSGLSDYFEFSDYGA